MARRKKFWNRLLDFLEAPVFFPWLRRVLVISLLVAGVFLGIFSAFIFHSLQDLRSVRLLESYSPPVPTRILDVKGRLIAQFYAEKREIIPFEEIPPLLVQATLSTEDEHFLTHYGFNPWRILKALIFDVVTLSADQGGSTITVQLSKLLFLHHKKSITRKVMELWYAIQIERLYTKKEILWFYFNQVNYGHGCYGVEAAAKFFFGKKARDLSLAECALLAGIPKSPVYFSPLRYPKQSMQRHRVVLAGLVRGHYVTPEESSEQYQDFWIDFTSKIRSRESTISDLDAPEAPYFVEYVRDRLEKLFTREQLYKGGLVVYTTLNLDHQRSAEKHLREKVDEQNKYYKQTMSWIENEVEAHVYDQVQAFAGSFFLPIDTAKTKREKKAQKILYDNIKDPLKSVALLLGQADLFGALQNAPESAGLDESVECAFISIEPTTGYITAMSGGSGFHYNNQFNHVFLAKRQIGSAVKPFIYAPAIDKKLITAATVLQDVPIAIGEGRSDELYTPNNYGGDFQGSIRVREALRRSINTCALRVLDMVTPETVREYSKKILDIRTDQELYEKFPKDFTMGLGTGSFTPYDMVTSFAAFANEGREVIPLSIRYVTDRSGDVLTNFEKTLIKASRREVVSPATAFIMSDMLRGVFEGGGTANVMELDGFTHREVSSGKTGTTGNWTDSWFVGYNKRLCTAVWFGYDSNKSLGKGRTGGSMAAPVWVNFNKDVLAGVRPIPFTPPEGVVKLRVSTESGKLESPSTRVAYDEYFIRGSEPTEFDDATREEFSQKMNFVDLVQKKNRNASTKNFMDALRKMNASGSNDSGSSNR